MGGVGVRARTGRGAGRRRRGAGSGGERRRCVDPGGPGPPLELLLIHMICRDDGCLGRRRAGGGRPMRHLLIAASGADVGPERVSRWDVARSTHHTRAAPGRPATGPGVARGRSTIMDVLPMAPPVGALALLITALVLGL